MKELEDRLSRMESTLRSSSAATAVPPEPPATSEEPDSTSRDVSVGESDAQPLREASPESATEALRMPSPPSNEARPSPVTSEPTGTTRDHHPHRRLQMPPLFQQIFERLKLAKSGGYRDVLARPITNPVLAPESELWLLEQTVNAVFAELPLFQAAKVVERLKGPHRVFPSEVDRQWDVCMDAIRAGAIPVRTINGSFREVAVLSWAFFKNAYLLLPELILEGQSLTAVQALLGMALFTRASTDARTTSRFLSLAVHTSHSIGLQTANSSQGLKEPNEAAMRNRVFWIAYILDVEASSLHSVPGAIRCEDIDLELPAAGESDCLALRVFRLRADLATVESSIRRRLYAARALQQPDVELIDTVDELARLLEVWRATVPAALSPQIDSPSKGTADPPVVLLHLSFFGAVSMARWAARRLCGWANPAQNWLPASSHLVRSACPLYTSVQECRAAARSTLLTFMENVGEWPFMEFW